jgi:hypothetical protein
MPQSVRQLGGFAPGEYQEAAGILLQGAEALEYAAPALWFSNVFPTICA